MSLYELKYQVKFIAPKEEALAYALIYGKYTVENDFSPVDL